jgi:tetratricopeptide (TPR) repeat protein
MRSIRVIIGVLAAVVVSHAGLLAQDSASVLMDQGHWKRARAIAQSKYIANPNDPDANYLMGRVYLEWDDVASAEKYAEKAVQLAPQNAEYHWLYARVLGEQAERAGLFKQIGLARHFRSEVETALKLDPKHVEAHYGMMVYYYKAPGIVGGDKKKAYAEAETIAQISASKGYLAKVKLAQEDKQNDKIPDLYRKALEANPKEFEAIIALFNQSAGAAQRDLAQSESYARQAIAADPNRTAGYSAVAWVMAFQKRWADLDGWLADTEKRFPDDFGPYMVVSSVLLNNGDDLPRAERYVRKYLAIEREPHQVSPAVAHWRLALILEKQNRKQDAIAELETAVKADGNLEGAKKDLKRLRG